MLRHAGIPAITMVGQPRTRLRTVLVDDEAGLRTLLRSMLEQHGCCEVVAEAGGGAEAVERLRGRECALVVLDCEVPGLDGPPAPGLPPRQPQGLGVVAHSPRRDAETRGH